LLIVGADDVVSMLQCGNDVMVGDDDCVILLVLLSLHNDASFLVAAAGCHCYGFGLTPSLPVLCLFSINSPDQMLAMKFLHYAQEHKSAGDEEAAATTSSEPGKPRLPPASLFQLAAAMIKVGRGLSFRH